EGVVAPAVDGAVDHEGAGVGLAEVEVRDLAEALDLDGAAAVGGRAVAELAVGVAAPALGGAVVEEGAGVGAAGGDLRHGAEAGDEGGDLGQLVARAELAVGSGAPAGDVAVLEEDAGVAAAGGELLDGRGEVDLESLLRVPRGGALAELAV